MKQSTLFLLLILLSCTYAPDNEYDPNAVEAEYYFLVGMIQDYAGRSFVEYSDEAEWFYPSESTEASIFEYHAKAFCELKGYSDPILIHEASGHHHITSLELKKCIDSCFVYNFDSCTERVDINGEWMRACSYVCSINTDKFEGISDNAKLNYLRGAYLRQRARSFSGCTTSMYMNFANSCYKIDYITKYLSDFGCTIDSIHIESGGYPTSQRLYYSPSDLICEEVIRKEQTELNN